MKHLYLLDSNLLIGFFKKHEHTVELMNSLWKAGSLAISALTVMEVREGWDDAHEQVLLPRLAQLVVIEDLTLEIANCAGKLRHDYRQKGVTLQPIDTLIAATAIVKEMIMVTYNVKHYEPIKELTLYTDLLM